MKQSIEHQYQTQLFIEFEKKASKYPELLLAFAIPNGGGRVMKQNRYGQWYSPAAVKLKKEGLKKGVPDIFLPIPRGTYHGMFIEMKSPTGALKPEQKAWLESLDKQGYKCIVGKDWKPVLDAIIKYLEQ